MYKVQYNLLERDPTTLSWQNSISIKQRTLSLFTYANNNNKNPLIPSITFPSRTLSVPPGKCSRQSQALVQTGRICDWNPGMWFFTNLSGTSEHVFGDRCSVIHLPLCVPA